MSKSVYEQALGAHRSVLALITAHAVPCSCACGPYWCLVRPFENHTRQPPVRLESSHQYERVPPRVMLFSRPSCRAQPSSISLGRHGAFTYVLVSSEGVLTVTGSCRDETCGSPEITSRRLIAGALLDPRTWPGRDDGPCSPR